VLVVVGAILIFFLLPLLLFVLELLALPFLLLAFGGPWVVRPGTRRRARESSGAHAAGGAAAAPHVS